MSFEITISGDAATRCKTLSDPARVFPALTRSMDQQNQLSVSRIQRVYMSFPKSGPAVADGLRVQSNRLRSSIRATRALPATGGIESSIGSNVEYAAIHEFGAEIPSRPTRSRNKYYAKKHPVTQAYTLPARRPVQHGIEDRLGDYSSAFEAAIMKLR